VYVQVVDYVIPGTGTVESDCTQYGLDRVQDDDNEDGACLLSIYAGSSSRPSLDEAIQEGILGLARVADRYDPSRGLRFATYSTHWVTSFVRNCFQESTTGTLRIPSQLHLIRVRACCYDEIVGCITCM
jgi:hypothetical protein